MAKRSSDSTAMSASFPTSMLPRSFSSWMERAAQMVHMRSASFTDSASSGWTTPLSRRRVTAVFMWRNGFTASR